MANGKYGSMADLMEVARKRKEAEQHKAIDAAGTSERDEPIETSKPPQSSQPQESKLSQSSQPTQDSSKPPQGWQPPQSSQLSQSSQPRESKLREAPLLAPNLIASLPDVPGYSRLPNRMVDHLLPLLGPFEQLVYLRLWRLSHGSQREPSTISCCTVSLNVIAAKTQLSVNSVKRAITRLEERGLVRKIEHVFGYGKSQGVTYEIVAPDWRTSDRSQPRQSSQPPQSSQPSQSSQPPQGYITHVLTDSFNSGPSVYDFRRLIARLTEARRGDPEYTENRLRDDLRAALTAQGIEWDEALVTEALRK
jgi:hypothetical protein